MLYFLAEDNQQEKKVFDSNTYYKLGFLVAQTVNNRLQCRRPGFDPWVGRSPGEGNGNPLQYSCLENPKDRGAWWATVHGVAKSQTRLSDFTFTIIRMGTT